MTPQEKYRLDLARPGFIEDPDQARAVEFTQRLYEQVISLPEVPKTARRLDWFNRPVWVKKLPTIKGLYLWGGVGRGKTYIVDSFYECLHIEHKLRIHFHSFMQMIHGELRALKDVKNPLDVVAERLAERARIICLDEFHVSDITDAMLLAGLLKALFARGIALVATSNEAPDQLYRNGLQRDRFLPAIESLKENLHILRVDGGTDYRLRTLEQAEIYHCPLDAQAETSLADSFVRLAPEPGTVGETITIADRPLATVRCADGIIWFEFEVLCGGALGPGDYLEIARCYHTVLLANIPELTSADDDRAKRFITMVDTFYDRNVILIASAAVASDKVYSGARLAEAFKRTASRLTEMATREYLAREHLS